MNAIKQFRDKLNQIEIRPKAVLSFSTFDKKTGEESGEKSVKLAFAMTLWHLILAGVAAVCVLNTLSALRKAFMERETRKEIMRELEKKREKEDAAKEADNPV